MSACTARSGRKMRQTLPNRLRRVSVRRPARPSSTSSRTQTTCPEHRTTWQHGTRPRGPKRQSRNLLRPDPPKRKRHQPPPGRPNRWALIFRRGRNRSATWANFSAPTSSQSGGTRCASLINTRPTSASSLKSWPRPTAMCPASCCWNRGWWSSQPRRRRHCWPTSTCWNVPGWRSTTLAAIRSFCARFLPMWSRAAPKTFSWSWRRSWPTAAATP